MAPNTGQGANCAIEDAAALANFLSELINTRKYGDRPSNQEIQSILQRFSQSRIRRVKEIYKTARMVVRLHARQNLLLQLVGRFYLPYAGDLPAEMASKVIAGAVQLGFLPPSQRTGPGWENFRRKGRVMSRYTTVFSVLAIVLCLVVWVGNNYMHPAFRGDLM
jgi:hypothetical protein